MDDNARPHRARIVEEYLEDHGLKISRPESIEHLWDYLGREFAALNPHSEKAYSSHLFGPKQMGKYAANIYLI
ncbi:hypothetical protein TNCV_3622401 [Trichonephila clavipes]|nr:hypothetical protein TNCV_3622401 [Trichonephila clavipes]